MESGLDWVEAAGTTWSTHLGQDTMFELIYSKHLSIFKTTEHIDTMSEQILQKQSMRDKKRKFHCEIIGEVV